MRSRKGLRSVGSVPESSRKKGGGGGGNARGRNFRNRLSQHQVLESSTRNHVKRGLSNSK